MKKAAITLFWALYVAVFIGGSLFLSAGRLDIPFFWANLLVWVVFMIIIASIMDLDLMRERGRAEPGARGRLIQILGLPVIASHFIIAGLDVGRYHWSDLVPLVLQIAGLVVLTLSFGLVAWAFSVNPFFSKAIRIQEDRGHQIITSGPYKHVRHPGYTAFTFMFLSSGLALGSWLSFVPALAIVIVFIRRVVVEDRLLQEELEGYADYSKHVRYRLIPGVW